MDNREPQIWPRRMMTLSKNEVNTEKTDQQDRQTRRKKDKASEAPRGTESQW